jgi:transposase
MTYSIDIINLCFEHLYQNTQKKIIAEKLMISINTIHYWINKYYNNYINKIKITNNTINEYKKNNIHKSKKRHLYSTRITEYVNTNNGDSLDNICKNATDSCLSKSTVCRELKELKITYKKINKYIVCKDINSIENDRKNYAKNNNINIDKFNNSICIDESGFNIDDIVNKGYSAIGKPINRMIKHKHNKLHYNLLMAISNNQIIAYEITKESFNSDKYLAFLTKHTELFKNKTLLQDNVRFHHSKIVKKYTAENNIGMNYIPAYSPIFNPIEMSFYNCPIVYRPFRAYIQYWGMKN